MNDEDEFDDVSTGKILIDIDTVDWEDSPDDYDDV